MAYDGYLSSCAVFFDANDNGALDAGEDSALLQGGSFAVNLINPAQLPAGLLRLEPAAGSATASVAAGATTCHDIATLLPERLPLAAIGPDACGDTAAPTVISALSTLLTTEVAVTQEALKQALALPTGVTIGRHNAFQVSCLKRSVTNVSNHAVVGAQTNHALFTMPPSCRVPSTATLLPRRS